MFRIFVFCIIIFACHCNLFAQLSYLETHIDGEGGIEGIQYPEYISGDNQGNNLYIAAENCLTHLRKTNSDSNFDFVETFRYSSDFYDGLWNTHEVKTNHNGRFLYLSGDHQLNIFAIDTISKRLVYVKSIKNTNFLELGYASNSWIAISPDDKFLYYASTYSTQSYVHIFSINPETGELGYRGPAVGGWIEWNYFNALVCSPSNENLYALTREYNTGKTCLSVFERDTAYGNLQLIQTVETEDSISAATQMTISSCGKFMYIYDNLYIKVFAVNPDGTLSYSDRLHIPSCFDGFMYSKSLVISKDNLFLYVGGDKDLSVFAINGETGTLSFVQVLKEGYPNNPGFFNLKSVFLSNHDSILYAVSKYNHTLHVFSRNSSSGKINLVKNIVDQQGKISGLSGSSALLSSHDNNSVITLTMYSSNPLALFDRSEDGSLHFRGNVKSSELGPAIGAASSFILSPDDKYMYIASANMFGIRLMKSDAARKSYSFSSSYTVTETGMAPAESIYAAALSSDMKNYYACTYSNIVSYSINKSNAELTFQTLHKISENSGNGLKGIISAELSADNKFLFTCSNSMFSPGGITVYARNTANGNLTFIQKTIVANVTKVILSRDGKFVYALGNMIYCYAVDPVSGNLEFKSKLDISALGFPDLYKFSDGLISNDNRSLIGITKQGKAILTFYRNRETGGLLFQEMLRYSANSNYSSDNPKIVMSSDSKNIYLVSPYDNSLVAYTANVPVGLPEFMHICEGDSAKLIVDGDYDFLWSDGNTKNQIITSVPGTYSVYVTDSIGREGRDTTEIVSHQVPDVKLNLETFIEGNDTSLYLYPIVSGGEAPFTYLWNNGSASYQMYFSTLQEYLKNDFYIKVTDYYGCSSSDTILNGVGFTGVNKTRPENAFSFYPNPVSDKLNIIFSPALINKSSLIILNSSGKIIFHSIVEMKVTDCKIDMSKYSSGVYYLKFTSGKQKSLYKIVKQ